MSRTNGLLCSEGRLDARVDGAAIDADDASSSSHDNAVLRVLVADDHDVVRAGLRAALEAEGFVVAGEARDGLGAVYEALRLGPEAIVLDVWMPGQDGVEATRRIKEHCPGAVIVILTVADDPEVVAAALDAGAVAVVTKDRPLRELAAVLRSATGSRSAPASSASATRAALLTARERQVLEAFASGCATTEQVARRIFVSPRTVKNHLANIYDKLGARSRTEAIVAALARGMVRVSGVPTAKDLMKEAP
jgi:DNA-binding NarL/FixJ family response regulator